MTGSTGLDEVVCIDIRFGDTKVPVLLGTGAGFDRTTDEAIRALTPDRVLVAVDARVARLYPADVARFAALGEQPGVVFVAPEGESCKTLSVLGDLAETFLAGGATKRSLVLAFGGGATMNLGGLAAALIYRGLPLCYVPTTLMAQNDVVPSKKTAINLCSRKNNFGTFHAASLNVVNPRYLHTLPPDELRSGMGELVKNALILGGEHFDVAERMLDAAAAGPIGDTLLEEMVEAGIRAKLPSLQIDEREACAGMIFEYGHTVGHALELSFPKGALPHGLAICWGMLSCSYVASRLGLMRPADVARHDALVRRLLPEPLPAPYPTIDEVIFRVMRDGKRGRAGESADECSCVLLAGIGRPHATPTMLSKFPVSLVADWLREQGLKG
jgi:3-dehydroquinate synthase/2-deoxy-scyllo-inosose synthase